MWPMGVTTSNTTLDAEPSPSPIRIDTTSSWLCSPMIVMQRVRSRQRADRDVVGVHVVSTVSG